MILRSCHAILNPIMTGERLWTSSAGRLGSERSAIEKRTNEIALISNAQPKPMVVITATLSTGANARPRL
jgi:hypothetical protein